MNPVGVTGFVGSGLAAQTVVDPFDTVTAQTRILLISFSSVPRRGQRTILAPAAYRSEIPGYDVNRGECILSLFFSDERPRLSLRG
jgi:hypothetical protein